MTVGSGREDEWARPVAGQRDENDGEREVREQQGLRTPGCGLEAQRTDRAEDRVREQDADGREQDRVRRIAGGGDERDGDGEARPAEEGDERAEPTETGDGAGIELGTEPGLATPGGVAQLLTPSATRGARRRRGRALQLRAGLGQDSFLKPTEAYI